MSGREVAWRMLAHEYSQSVEEERATEERAASYVLSPLGARVNRVLLVGTLGPSEAIGRDAEAPFYRSRLDDPTGSITVTAGSFQPRAMEAIRTVSAPTEAMVVGKAHVFRGRDGTAYPSVRAESVRPVSAEEYRALLAEAVAQTLRRLALTREIAGGSTDEALRAAGFPTGWIRSARAARARYPDVDPESFRPPLRRAYEALEGGPAGARAPTPPPAAAAPGRRPVPSGTEGESTFLEILDEIAQASADGYADLAELVERAARHGIDEERAEELLGRLEESGAVEEPIVGKLRRA